MFLRAVHKKNIMHEQYFLNEKIEFVGRGDGGAHKDYVLIFYQE